MVVCKNEITESILLHLVGMGLVDSHPDISIIVDESPQINSPASSLYIKTKTSSFSSLAQMKSSDIIKTSFILHDFVVKCEHFNMTFFLVALNNSMICLISSGTGTYVCLLRSLDHLASGQFLARFFGVESLSLPILYDSRFRKAPSTFWLVRTTPTFLVGVKPGHYILSTQTSCDIVRDTRISLNITIDLHCLIPPKWVPFNDLCSNTSKHRQTVVPASKRKGLAPRGRHACRR